MFKASGLPGAATVARLKKARRSKHQAPKTVGNTPVDVASQTDRHLADTGRVATRLGATLVERRKPQPVTV